MIKRILKYIWTIYFFVSFVLIFLILYPAFLILLSREKWYPKAHYLRKIWGKILMIISGLYGKTEYEEPLQKNKAFEYLQTQYQNRKNDLE